jgi:hypothetical protein
MQEVVENIKNKKSSKMIREGYYIVNFHNQQDLIDFIEEKIKNRYRFFLQPYIRNPENQ